MCIRDSREIVSEIAMLMCYEATRDLPLQKARVDTPLGRAQVQVPVSYTHLCAASCR